MKTNILVLISLLIMSSCRADNPDSRAFSQIISPEIPESVTFAGQTVFFNRYDIRERIDRELINFCYMHSNTLLILKRANRYLPEIEHILKEENIPDDFKYLMIIESNANPLSRSGIGASGLWQFMETTAREYGLEVNSNIDERYNTAKATHAACRYLHNAKNRCGSWFAAAASYNAGQTAIERQLGIQCTEDALDLYLNSETSRYMFRIMAAKIILSNPEDYGFHIRTDQLYPPFGYKTVTVTVPIDDLAAWAKTQGITYAQLRDANPWLRTNQLPNKTGRKYEIRIPTQESIYYDPLDTRCNLPFCK